jgi:hypothetical protein
LLQLSAIKIFLCKYFPPFARILQEAKIPYSVDGQNYNVYILWAGEKYIQPAVATYIQWADAENFHWAGANYIQCAGAEYTVLNELGQCPQWSGAKGLLKTAYSVMVQSTFSELELDQPCKLKLQ